MRKRDPSSLVQLLVDSASFQKLFGNHCSPESLDVRLDPCTKLHQGLDPLFRQHTDGLPLLSNARVASKLAECINHILDEWPEHWPSEEVLNTVWRTVSRGSAYPQRHDHSPVTEAGDVVKFLDHLNHDPLSRLMDRAMHALALRTQLELEIRVAHVHRKDNSPARPETEYIISRLIRALGIRDAPSLPQWTDPNAARMHRMLKLAIWVRHSFSRHWDGKPEITLGTVQSGAIEVFEVLSRQWFDDLIWLPECTSDELTEIAATWPTFYQSSGNGQKRHLLSFKCMFSDADHSTVFRIINHLKMRDAHTAAEVAMIMRRGVAARKANLIALGKLQFHEQHYLLLVVTRENILRDAFDGLWQRRRGELHLPLRVRLGEASELEVGHDLGGVQVEFFNLICKRIFAEDLQMFTTLPESGISYFRPMSLQPLYMFELFGLLMGLAIFNGITLPVNLPLALYMNLVSSPKYLYGGERLRYNVRSLLRSTSDAWPSITKSLRQFLSLDLDLDHEMPLEANGLRMTVAPMTAEAAMHSSNPADGRRQLNIYSAVPILADGSSSMPVSIPGIATAWPGWRLEASPTSPEPVTAATKEEYVRSMVDFVTYVSVAPQFDAFKKGFFTVMDPHTMTMFHSAEAFQAHVEGSATLDLDMLRGATRYDGYYESSRYIRAFWDIVASWPHEKQKQLLKFVTAAERLPRFFDGRAGSLAFVIKHATPLSMEHLPTSSTCFGTLLLPRYSNAEILEEKLDLALKYGLEGFGTG